jgi:glycosyltransferase involved in cell wall biosynthesis
MTRRVTVAIPVYKRLRFLPGAVASVAAQDYPEIDLLVSDNGENGPEVRELVEQHYDRPFRFRRNDATVPMSIHFNQLVENAEGEYYTLLSDDDEISPGFVSTLAARLDADPEVRLSLPRVDVLDEDGSVRPSTGSPKTPPDTFSGVEFVRMWIDGKYGFWNFITMMARVSDIRAIGGYTEMVNGDDDLLALKLALGHKVSFAPEAVFGNRWYESSEGLKASPWELAADIKTWLDALDNDAVLQDFAHRDPRHWSEVRDAMRAKGWRTYRHRYRNMYRNRMPRLQWLRAGFAMPFIPEYYRWLIPYQLRAILSRAPAER